MAEGDGFIYNKFKELVMEGNFNLASGGNTVKVTLHTGYTPNIDTHFTWADVKATEYTTAAGYTAGGQALSGQDVTLDTTNDLGKFDATDITWTSLGPLTPNTPSHVIMWANNSVVASGLVAYWVLGTTPTNGGNYTLQWGAGGIITLT